MLRENDNPESMSMPIRIAVDVVALVSETALDERYDVRDKPDIAHSLRRALFSVARKTVKIFSLGALSL